MAAPPQVAPHTVPTHHDEKPVVDHSNGSRLSSDEDKPKDIHSERNALLANLPDPDEGKSEEERRKIDRKLMWKVDVSDRRVGSQTGSGRSTVLADPSS